jgi:hypothetical protein
VRVDGDGEISPVDGTAENSEFCAGAWACAGSRSLATRARISPSASRSRPQTAAVAGVLFMTPDVFGSNRGDFKPIGRMFVTSLTPC